MARWLAGSLILVMLLSGCSTARSEDQLRAQPEQVPFPDPPWRTEPPVPATGLNASLLVKFHDPRASNQGCAPIGIDTSVWDPPPSFEWTGFVYITTWGTELTTQEQIAGIIGEATSWTEWSDGSVSVNNQLVDGTYRFDVNIPVDEDGERGDWCTYIYDPTSEGETGEEIIQALRFIEQPSSPTDVDRG